MSSCDCLKFNLLKCRIHLSGCPDLRVVVYGRVSTEHEMQASAFENQILWYQDIIDRSRDRWELVKPIGTYLDYGITGTQAKKRPGFLKMIEDAENKEFDLVITREVCRFARNTYESIMYVRELKKCGVAVYFINDGINTMDPGNEMVFTIMSVNAQEESRKISERVKAGQNIARKRGILYGTSRILGYDRVHSRQDDIKKNAIGDKNVPTFVINEEEAETIRMIYALYIAGNGLKKIKDILTSRERKNSSGEVKWFESTISRILSNTMYIGKQQQRKTEVVDYLTGETKRRDPSEYELIDGDFEPIISVNDFNAAQLIKKARINKKGKVKKQSWTSGRGDFLRELEFVVVGLLAISAEEVPYSPVGVSRPYQQDDERGDVRLRLSS